MLAIGLVVDDAIVVVENVHRHVDAGESGFVAAIKSARELTLPIIVMSTTLVAVFLPVAFSGGLTSILFTEFAFTIVFSVLISMLLALTLSPVMCGWLLRPTPDHGLTHFLETTYGRLRGRPTNARSRASCATRWSAWSSPSPSSASLFFLFSSVRSELSPPQNQGVVFAIGTANPDISPDLLDRDSKQMLAEVRPVPGEERHLHGHRLQSRRRRHQRHVRRHERAPGQTHTGTRPHRAPAGSNCAKRAGPQALGVDAAAAAGLHQPAADRLRDQGGQRVLRAARSRGAGDRAPRRQASGKFAFLQKNLKIDQPQYRLVVDRKLAGSLGISMDEIAAALQPLLSGGWVNHFTMQGYSYEVIPQAPDASAPTLDDLDQYHVRAADGTLVPLSTLVHFETRTIPESLPQFNRVNSATLIGMPAPGVSQGDALALSGGQLTARNRAQTATTSTTPAIRASSRKQGNTFVFAIVLALILVYLLMSAQFNSFRDALIVMLTIPMSVAGALIFMSLGFATLNIYTEIALITLLGLITKQGILVVQFANQIQQHEGLGKLEAVKEAAAVRLRPILMTTLAMVLGVIPLIAVQRRRRAAAPPARPGDRHRPGIGAASSRCTSCRSCTSTSRATTGPMPPKRPSGSGPWTGWRKKAAEPWQPGRRAPQHPGPAEPERAQAFSKTPADHVDHRVQRAKHPATGGGQTPPRVMPGGEEHAIHAEGVGHFPIVTGVADQQGGAWIDTVRCKQRFAGADLAAGQTVGIASDVIEELPQAEPGHHAPERRLLGGRQHELPHAELANGVQTRAAPSNRAADGSRRSNSSQKRRPVASNETCEKSMPARS